LLNKVGGEMGNGNILTLRERGGAEKAFNK